MSTIHIKRIYEAPEKSDGTRILVDRLWPRGIRKENAGIVFWARDAAPSNELRKWYNHDPDKWSDFRERYFAELNANPEAVTELKSHLKGRVVTFLFSSKETELNNARALKEYIEQHP